MNITVRQIEFKSTNEINTVFGWIYIPAEPACGIVQIVHGMAEHMGRYHEMMRFLAQNGYIACGIDHIGHGRSALDEQYGFLGEKDGWKTLIDDQYKFHKIVHTELPDKRHPVLLGHSMGSFIARLYAAKYPQSISGLVLSGTARGGLKVELALKAASHSIKKNGVHFIDRDLDRLVFGGFNDRFKPIASGHEWLSRDPDHVRQYSEDPKCGFKFTASALYDLFLLISKANDRTCFQAFAKDLPILLISGSMDPVGEYGKGPAQVYSRYIKAGVADVEMVVYEGGRHEPFHELNRDQVVEELLGWLNNHLGGSEKSDFE
ncbi:alpha/beta hydrolase [Oscillospiraceae bacterium PP1C4]